MKISQLVQWAELKWYKRKCSNYISHQATFQSCPKARNDLVVWKIFSPHQSLSPPPPEREDGVNPGHWGVDHRDACDQALMARATVFSTLLLPSAERSTQEARSICLWERQVQTTAFIWLCTSFCITFSSFTFHNANLYPNSFTLIQLLRSN